MRTPPSAPSPPPCAAAKRKAADREVFSGDMIREWGQSFRLVFAHPSSTQGRLRLRCSLGSPCLPRGAVCRSRLRGFPFGTRYGLSSHRNVFSKHPGVPVGLFSDSAPTHLRCAGVPLGLFGKPKRSSFSRVRGLHQAIPLLQNARPSGSLRSPSDAAPNQLFELLRCFGRLFFRKSFQLFLQNARPPGSLRSPFGGRGELRSPLHPPLLPPLFIGRFAAFDRQIPKEDVFIPPNAAFAQLSLAHSAAFCYSFLNNRTRCGKRRLLP